MKQYQLKYRDEKMNQILEQIIESAKKIDTHNREHGHYIKIDRGVIFDRVKEICVEVGYTIEDFCYIYRLGNKYVLQLINSDNPKELYKQILDEIDFDPVTLYKKKKKS